MSVGVGFQVKTDITLHRRMYELWLIENVGYKYEDGFSVATSYFTMPEAKAGWELMKADLQRIHTISAVGELDRIVSWRGHGWELFVVRYYDYSSRDNSRFEIVIKFRNAMDAMMFKLVKSSLDPDPGIFA